MDGSILPFVVEAPGTAPGSDRFITMTVYRHSWLPSRANIGELVLHYKGL